MKIRSTNRRLSLLWTAVLVVELVVIIAYDITMLAGAAVIATITLMVGGVSE